MMTVATVSSGLQCLNIRTIDMCKIECFVSNYSVSFSYSFYIFDLERQDPICTRCFISPELRCLEIKRKHGVALLLVSTKIACSCGYVWLTYFESDITTATGICWCPYTKNSTVRINMVITVTDCQRSGQLIFGCRRKSCDFSLHYCIQNIYVI